METNELLQQILAKVSGIDQRLERIENRLDGVESRHNQEFNAAELNGLKIKTATQDNVIRIQDNVTRINVKLELLNKRLFEQETEMRLAK